MKAVDNLEVLCRDQEYKQLVNLLGNRDEPVPQSIFLCGQKSSGKTFTLSRVLQKFKINHATVNCIEGYTSRLLFEPIIAQLKGRDPSESFQKCDDILEFITQLNSIAKQDATFGSQINAIVLDNAERLRDMAPTFLPALLKLQELSDLKKVTVILVTNIVWEKFLPPGGISPPIQIFFPQYTQAEILKILSLDMPSDYPNDFYVNYLQLFVSVFLRSCRDVRELKYQAKSNFRKYCKPVEDGDIDINDARKLWQNIAPHLKASLQIIYMRTEVEDTLATDDSQQSLDKRNSLSSSAKFALSFELPYYAKYFLIAAYLASHNSPKEDKKLFVKLSGRTKKAKPRQQKNSNVKLSSQLVGPRVFDFERLLAIFYSIVEEKPHVSVNLFAQVTTLVQLQLLSKVGDDPLDTPKYKCVVGLDFIVIIAKTLNFSVTKYLLGH